MPRLAPKFKKALRRLDFDTSGKEEPRLLFTSDLRNPKKKFSAKELFTLELAEIHKATAVYFRRFPGNGREPLPQIFIYDNSKSKLSPDDIADIHRNLWSSCLVPMYMVMGKSNVLIYDCREPVSIDIATDKISANAIDVLELANMAQTEWETYSGRLFDNGAFWEQDKAKEHFSKDKTAYARLLTGLKNIRSTFLTESNLPKEFVHKLLVHCILIKYLEERGNSEGRKFAEEYFTKFGSSVFCDILRQGRALEVFDDLSSPNKFNGGIFEWDKAKEKDWRNLLITRKNELEILAGYLDGRIIQNNQLLIWKEFSFAYLPVELVSSIYETFLKDPEETGIVYTPDHLVSLMIDECMPPNEWEGKETFKVLDGSCGSGIFLVKAFKRMVEWWRYKRYSEKGEIKKPNITSLQSILRNNIFGIELKPDAAQLSIFSLAVALCDELTPSQIWHELKFEDLQATGNIRALDFFKCVKSDTEKYHLVIGNPPFDKIGKEIMDEIMLSNQLAVKCKRIPQHQVALLFLDQLMQTLKKSGRLALVMPARPLLYDFGTKSFRQFFFENYKVHEILDFSNLRNELFEGQAKVPVIAFFAENTPADGSNILHLTIDRTTIAKHKLYFEFDHYDIHWVSIDDAMHEPFVWKLNRLGGGRLIDLIKRLRKHLNIGSYLNEKQSSNNWLPKQGYEYVEQGDRTDEKMLALRYKLSPYLYQNQVLKTSKFTSSGIPRDAFETEEHRFFHRPKELELFTPPIVLIKLIIENGIIPIHFSDEVIKFRKRIFGIKAPKADREELLDFYEMFKQNNDLYNFLITVKSSEYLMGRETAIKKEDLMDLPMNSDLKQVSLSFQERIIQKDVLNYLFEHLAGDSEFSKISQAANKTELAGFISTYCKVLNSIYKSGKKEFKFTTFVEGTCYYALTFQLTSKEYKPDFTKKDNRQLEKLLLNEYRNSARLMRVIKLYQKGQRITIVKPKQLRYWLSSIALRDADETFDEILDQSE